jgi:hypothetical protein
LIVSFNNYAQERTIPGRGLNVHVRSYRFRLFVDPNQVEMPLTSQAQQIWRRLKPDPVILNFQANLPIAGADPNGDFGCLGMFDGVIGGFLENPIQRQPNTLADDGDILCSLKLQVNTWILGL